MPKNRRDTVTPPRLPQPPSIPTGPRMYKIPRDRGIRSGPGIPPAGWGSGVASSGTEWPVYWALQKIFGQPSDARVGPFYGAPGIWAFQKAVDGGRHGPGGSVVDFVVYAGRRSRNHDYAFRIQTEHFHNYVDSEKQAYDTLQAWRLAEFYAVVDIYDYEFMGDPSGQSLIILLKRALNGETYPAPGATGNVQRVRPGMRLG